MHAVHGECSARTAIKRNGKDLQRSRQAGDPPVLCVQACSCTGSFAADAVAQLPHAEAWALSAQPLERGSSSLCALRFRWPAAGGPTERRPGTAARRTWSSRGARLGCPLVSSSLWVLTETMCATCLSPLVVAATDGQTSTSTTAKARKPGNGRAPLCASTNTAASTQRG
jgi:hypothetical protein